MSLLAATGPDPSLATPVVLWLVAAAVLGGLAFGLVIVAGRQRRAWSSSASPLKAYVAAVMAAAGAAFSVYSSVLALAADTGLR